MEPDHVVRETPWGYESGGTEPFFLWKDLRGHVLQPDQVKDLLTSAENTIGPIMLHPRVGSKGNSYPVQFRLARLDDEAYKKLPQRGKREPSRWRIEILSEDGSVSGQAQSGIQADEKVVRAFCTAKGGQTIHETNLRFADDAALKGERGGLTLPKDICKRAISHDEAKAYFEEGKTGLLTNFTSKRGRPFSATLILKPNGRHGFEFEPRKPRKSAAKEDKATKAKEA